MLEVPDAKQLMGITSKVAKASSNSPSVRSTIPEEIVSKLDVKVGDVLVWIPIKHEGKEGVFVRKLE